MFIIDSQVHIWAPETPEKPYAKENASAPHRAVPLGHDELLREMNGAGVTRCILVPPTWEADRNDTSLEAARLHPRTGQVALLGAVQAVNIALLKRELRCAVAIVIHRLYLRDDARFHRDNSHGNNPAFVIKNLCHPNLAAKNAFY